MLKSELDMEGRFWLKHDCSPFDYPKKRMAEGMGSQQAYNELQKEMNLIWQEMKEELAARNPFV